MQTSGELSLESVTSLTRYCLDQHHHDAVLRVSEIDSDEVAHNRVFLIRTGTAHSLSPSYVLKFCVLGFGPAKVENEVLSLMLLAKTCPKVPVPRVVAFSEDGQALHHYRQDRIGCQNQASTQGRFAYATVYV